MNVISFEGWKEQQAKRIPANKLIECQDCGGEGVRECCECHNEKDCDTCDSVGKLHWGELSKGGKDQYLNLDRYYTAVMSDIRALSEWQSKPIEQLLVDSGFCVFCSVKTKQMQIRRLEAA